MRKVLIKFLLWVGRARWIVDDEGDIGFQIFGLAVLNYKWNDSFVVYAKGGDVSWRLAEKREFSIPKEQRGCN